MSLVRSEPVPLPSLDPHETNPPRGPAADIAFRHSWWADDRRRIRSALESVFPASKRLSRFLACGDAAWVFQSAENPTRLKVCSDTCRDRWCRACQRDRSRIIAANLRDRLRATPVRLVTLTLRHRYQPLRHQVDRLLDHFRALRRRPLWADSIRGGVAFIEIKYKPEANRWHPHLHVLCTGNWIAQSLLSDTWAQVTGDSFVVDIRAVRDLDEVARYVAKYATKPMSTALYRHPSKLIEAVRALTGRHLCMTFGSFRGWRLTEPASDVDWVNLGSLESFQILALYGDLDAQWVLDALRPAPNHQKHGGVPP